MLVMPPASLLFDFCGIWDVSCTVVFVEPMYFCVYKPDDKSTCIEIRGKIIACWGMRGFQNAKFAQMIQVLKDSLQQTLKNLGFASKLPYKDTSFRKILNSESSSLLVTAIIWPSIHSLIYFAIWSRRCMQVFHVGYNTTYMSQALKGREIWGIADIKCAW